jgi:hypothetical protein
MRRETLKLVDFGISKITPRARKRKKGSAGRSKESGQTKRKKNCEGFGSIAGEECWR